MQPVPYLFFAGTCREAMTAYGKVFGAEPEMLKFSDMSKEDQSMMEGVPQDAIMHSSLKIGTGEIHASDDSSSDVEMKGCRVALTFSSQDETKRVFDALAEGGNVEMPLMPMSWSPGFGMLSDRFGTRWMIMVDGASA